MQSYLSKPMVTEISPTNPRPIFSQNHNNNNPGPGYYNSRVGEIGNIKTPYRKVKEQGSVSKEYKWIMEDDRNCFKTGSNGNAYIGPGSYDVSPSSINNVSPLHSIGKSSRFQRTKTYSVGPGYYSPVPVLPNSKGAAAAFKSRSFKGIATEKQKNQSLDIKNIRQKLVSDCIPQNIEQQDVKDVDSKKKIEVMPVFASKVPRFGNQSKQIKAPGPGSYDVVRLPKTRHLPRIMRLKLHKITPSQPSLSFSQSVGPGSYNLSLHQVSAEVQRLGYAVSRQTRFNWKKQKKVAPIQPGPGHYMNKKYVYIDEKRIQSPLKTPRRKRHQTTMKPKSTSNASLAHPPLAYDVDLYSIDYSLRKKLQHNYRLKLMEVAVPPFNSKVKRLT